MSVLDDVWNDLWGRRCRWVAEHLYMRRRGADPCRELSRELIHRIEVYAGLDRRHRGPHEGLRSRLDAHVTISEDGPRGREAIVVMAAAEWPGVMDPWSRIDRFSSLDAMARGESLRSAPSPRARFDSFDFPDEVRRGRERRDLELKYAQLALSPIKGEDDLELRRRHAVGRLVDICRVVAGAVAVQLAASLSLRRWWEIPRQSRSGGWMGLCAVHGYVRSRHSATSPGTCDACDVDADRRELVRWPVTWLADVARALGEVLSRRLQHSVDLLRSVVIQVGAALWESLGDWQKRVCLLEPERTPHALVGGTDRDPRFELLEFD